MNKSTISPDEVKLKVVDTLVLTPDTAPAFLSFIDRYLFRSGGRQQPTLEHIQVDFGDSSSLFMEVFAAMKLLYDDIAHEPEIQTAYREWSRFMSVAYGSFQASAVVFLVHTYLSVFSKLIAYEVISRDESIDLTEMRGAIDGSIFAQYNVENFVEKDFYQWVTIPAYFHRLSRYFIKVVDTIAEYDFTNVRGDILKGVYQHMIDLETRHALGEYYTPDWLCEKVADHFNFERNAQILDPSCGSGSFLIASVNRLRQLHPDLTPEELASQVAGIDIHPLSVQVAKTTLLLALGESVKQARRPIQLRVYLANSLLTPQLSTLDLFGNFSVTIDEKRYFLPNDAFDEPTLFDQAISIADVLATDTTGQAPESAITFSKIIRRNHEGVSDELLSRFYEIYLALKQAKETGRDSIWKFVLQNSYRPFFLRKQFDYVLGNPPWFTYNSIKNAEYQQLLRALALKYGLIPAKKANMPHLEIAAIFMSHVTSYLMRDKGKLAFVVPRSFLSAEHHDNTRSATAKGFRLTSVWDLENVSPLFNVPSCVLFAEQANVPKLIPKAGIDGLTISGRLKKHNQTLAEVGDRIQSAEVVWRLTKLQKSTALATTSSDGLASGVNFYKNHFKQGATIVPRNFYFVSLDGGTPPDWTDRVVSVRSDEANEKDGKMPWKELTVQGQVNTSYLFRTAIARNIIPFGLIAPPLVVLPVKQYITGNHSGTTIKLLDYQKILTNGDLQTSRWFKKVEELWNTNKTESALKMSFLNRIDFQKGLTDQNLNKRYLVLYTALGSNANSIVVDRTSFALPFFADYKTYVFYTDDADEAYFLSCYFNSGIANEIIKPFQAKGLFGERGIEKKILEIRFPQFKADNDAHVRLAELGRACAGRVAAFIEDRQLATEDYNVGRVRTEIRKSLLPNELAEIDQLLAGLIGA